MNVTLNILDRIVESSGVMTAYETQMLALLEQSSRLHRHVCPRQVLGVRMGLLAGDLLQLPVPQKRKRIYTIVETDGCFSDGVSVAVNCWSGRRTMRVEDYGKIAATFIDTKTNAAFRVIPHVDVRNRAPAYAPDAKNGWEAYLLGYWRMPLAQLFTVQKVALKVPIKQIISRNSARAVCVRCGEEIINEREVMQDGEAVCVSCVGQGFYWEDAVEVVGNFATGGAENAEREMVAEKL